MSNTYEIEYKVSGADSGAQSIDQLARAVASLQSAAGGGKLKLDIGAAGGTAAAKSMESISRALAAMSPATGTLQTVSFSMQIIEKSAVNAAKSLGSMNNALAKLAQTGQNVGNLASEMWRVSNGAIAADANVNKLGQGIGALGSQAAGVGKVRDQVVGVQRAAYGARKNFEDLSGAMGSIGSKAGGLTSASIAVKGLGGEAMGAAKSIRSASAGTRRLGSSLGALAGRIAVFHGLKSAIEGAGQALKSARDAADQGGRSNLDLRDTYRELANLQGKAGPDNEVMAGAMRFRLATGANDQEANDTLRRFEGGLPAAVKSGNITGSSTTGVAADFLRQAARTGIRVGMSGDTTGQLAAKIAQTSKVPDVDTGIKQFGTIVDLLNRGEGDLTPLVKSLVAGSGALVGPSGMFKTLPEYAAAMEVTSLNASPAVASTRVRQAATALGRFGERAEQHAPYLSRMDFDQMTPEARDEWVKKNYGQEQLRKLNEGKPSVKMNWFRNQFTQAEKHQDDVPEVKAGDTLAKLGITPNMLFEERINRLSGVLDKADNADVALSEAGFKNQAERRALIQLYQNRKLLTDETAAARKGVDPKDVAAKNRGFFAQQSAQDRISAAQLDASKFAQFTKDENLQIARQGAEGRLRDKGDIDTPASNFLDYMLDLAPTRIGGVMVDKMLGRETPQETLPVFLGGKSGRALRVDDEAMKRLQEQATKVGIDPGKFLADRFGGAQTTFDERFSELSKEVQKRGGNPFGSPASTDAQLREMIKEQQRTNKLLEDQARNKPPMPVQDRNRAADDWNWK